MEINLLGGISSAAVVRAARSDAGAPAALQKGPEERQPALPQSPEFERQPVEEAVSSIREFAQSIQRNLNFSLDDSTGRVVVKVTDGVSGEVIRQIPSEEALRLAETLDEVRSLLFNAQA
ncbi:flagellar protein FlaG [Ectopseudomonas guguanensis]|uniref:flagellar protein FlaG n=1 Tax=Ectopseudomonas guguanensis TaxID=1198456 RepID=UPI0028AFF971|nr:flagellar protein FlaG [Pseudomonas guguanensis]